MSKIIKKRILVTSGIILTIILAFIFIPKKININKSPPLDIKTNDQSGKPPENKKINIAFLEIDGKKYSSEITKQISISEFMEKLKNERKIDFKETNYAGMGKFIESINGIKNSGGLNWIYYVNGKKANIGVSNYKISNGDIVSWKYEKENF